MSERITSVEWRKEEKAVLWIFLFPFLEKNRKVGMVASVIVLFYPFTSPPRVYTHPNARDLH